MIKMLEKISLKDLNFMTKFFYKENLPISKEHTLEITAIRDACLLSKKISMCLIEY